jgi:hypothetical protein
MSERSGYKQWDVFAPNKPLVRLAPRNCDSRQSESCWCAMGLNGKNPNDAERDSADINVSAFVMGPALSLASCSPAPTLSNHVRKVRCDRRVSVDDILEVG